MTNTVHIQGSDGELVVDRATGAVLKRNGEAIGGAGYPEIEWFQPATLTGSHLDILECGYWTRAGAYEPPEPRFMAHVADLKAGGAGLL